MGVFAQAMREFESRLETPSRSFDNLPNLARQFLGGLNVTYPIFRHQVMEFCFGANVDPIGLARVILQNFENWQMHIDPQYFVNLANDWPLHYVCMARRLFWS